MNSEAVREKFGDNLVADDHTYKMGIDHRFTKHISERFRNREILETCTGAGFTTISLAYVASHVTTVEINLSHQMQARENVERVGFSDRVTFIQGDVLNDEILNGLPPVDAAFLDPDWADNETDHKYKFIHSNTRPPADILFERIFRITQNIAVGQHNTFGLASRTGGINDCGKIIALL